MNHSNILSTMVKEHMAKQSIGKEMQEKRKNEAIVAAHGLTEAVVEHLNGRISCAYNNQKRLDVECKKLESNGAELAKHAEQWIELVEQMNKALKEIGDIENWSRIIEKDVAFISGTLGQIHRNKINANNN